MNPKPFLVAGLFLFLFGVALLSWQWRGAALAVGLDQSETATPPLQPVESVRCLLPLADVRLASRVMAEHESQALTIVVNNQYNSVPCQATVTVAAGNFNLSPPLFSRTIEGLQPLETRALTWVLAPQRAGSFVVVVATEDQVQELGITVTTLLGLTVTQARVLGLLATFLGPMVTLPWWWEWWSGRRAKAAAA